MVTQQPLQLKTVEVAFTGGVVESVVAEHGLASQVRFDSAVAVGDLSGAGARFPSGLAFTATFAAGTVMGDVHIDYASPTTAIVLSGGTVTWSSTPRVAMMVQDLSRNVYVFTSGPDVSTLEVGLSSSAAGLSIASLGGLSAQVGPDFFGISRMDGSGVPLYTGVKLALASHMLDINASHPKSAVVAADMAPFDSTVFMVGVAFQNPCDSCSHFMRKLGNLNSVRDLDGDCEAGSASQTFLNGQSQEVQSADECYVSSGRVTVPAGV